MNKLYTPICGLQLRPSSLARSINFSELVPAPPLRNKYGFSAKVARNIYSKWLLHACHRETKCGMITLEAVNLKYQ